MRNSRGSILRKVRAARFPSGERSTRSFGTLVSCSGSLSALTCRGYPRRRPRSRAWRKKRATCLDALTAAAAAAAGAAVAAVAAAAAAECACALVAWRPTYVVCGRTQGRHTTAWCIGDPGGDDRRCAPSGWGVGHRRGPARPSEVKSTPHTAHGREREGCCRWGNANREGRLSWERPR